MSYAISILNHTPSIAVAVEWERGSRSSLATTSAISRIAYGTLDSDIVMATK